MKVTIGAGESVTVEFAESDGSITVEFNETNIRVVAGMPDNIGREGEIYREDFGHDIQDPNISEETTEEWAARVAVEVDHVWWLCLREEHPNAWFDGHRITDSRGEPTVRGQALLDRLLAVAAALDEKDHRVLTRHISDDPYHFNAGPSYEKLRGFGLVVGPSLGFTTDFAHEVARVWRRKRLDTAHPLKEDETVHEALQTNPRCRRLAGDSPRS